MRIALLCDARQPRHDVEDGGVDRADRHRGVAALAGVQDFHLQPLRMLHEALHRPEDLAALLGQSHALSRALEQLDAQRLLQHLDLLAQRRLRHPEALCRLAEVALFGNRQEVPKVP
jgi:hypothetical protein